MCFELRNFRLLDYFLWMDCEILGFCCFGFEIDTVELWFHVGA